MYQVNDVVIYGNQGVCKVTDVGPLDINDNDNKIYYTLNPVYQKGTIIYAPAENPKSVMRPVLSKDQANSLIKEIPDIETFRVGNDRDRESVYRSAIRTGDPRELVRIIKTVYLRRKDRLASGKKRIIVDEKYFQIAEDQLYQELAYALDQKKESMEEYISSNVTN